MWNISFKIYEKGQIREEGFDTSYEETMLDVVINIDDTLDLKNADKIELTINKLSF